MLWFMGSRSIGTHLSGWTERNWSGHLFARAAITKCHKLGSLQNKKYICLTILEANKSPSLLARWVPSESCASFPSLSLCFWCREGNLWCSLAYGSNTFISAFFTWCFCQVWVYIHHIGLGLTLLPALHELHPQHPYFWVILWGIKS